MKTQKIQNLLVVTLFCAAALAGLTACEAAVQRSVTTPVCKSKIVFIVTRCFR